MNPIDASFQAPGSEGLKCCWMLAGVVDYKLCDQQYECETCAFDEAMRNRRSRASATVASGRPLPSAAADSLLFHDRHVWARLEAGGRVRTGLDDFGRRLAGRIYCVQLPELGQRIAAGEPAWTVVHHEGEVSFAAPVAGIVEEVNERLRHNPTLVNQDPYGAGWAILLTPLDLVTDLRSLRSGSDAASWIAAESERLSREVARACGSHATLPDGGRLIDDLHEAVPSELRARVLDLFLSATTSRPSDRSKTETAAESEGR